MTDDSYREVAGELLDSLEIPLDFSLDDRAEVKPAIDGSGAWVMTWLWVPEK